MRSSVAFIRHRRFALTAGLLCFAWAFLAWLTVVPNQDILVDGIQAQSLVADPRIVLAFPGQKHGGPLEYPFTVLAEWVAPGNYFANAAVRPLLAFLTGFVVAELFLGFFPKAPKWAFLSAVAVGPTIIHGLLGPEGNPVGVWWLQPNWDMAWLCVSAGLLVLSKSAQAPWWKVAGGGLLVGLGFYAHPAIVLLIVPLVVLFTARMLPALRLLAVASAGALLGVLPAAVSYVVNSKVNTWDPSHGAFIAVDYYRDMGGAVLGLTGIPDYMFALLPYGLGLAPSTLLISGVAQSSLMWAFLIVVITTACVAVLRSFRQRQRLSSAGAVAVSWVAAIVTMFGFITFVDPVWIYSSGLAILFWLSVGALPSFFAREVVGVVVTVAVLLLAALSTVTHNAAFYSDIPARISAKVHEMNQRQEVAAALSDAGADVVFGSYYDAVPVGYASGGALRTITNYYNRFPLTPAELRRPSLTVAVNTQPTDPWGDEALDMVTERCARRPSGLAPVAAPYDLFDCPPVALAFNR